MQHCFDMSYRRPFVPIFLLKLIHFVSMVVILTNPIWQNLKGRASVYKEPQCRCDESLTTDVDVFISRKSGAGAVVQCCNVVFMLSTHRETKTFLSNTDMMQYDSIHAI